jgi:hypothetical protein
MRVIRETLALVVLAVEVVVQADGTLVYVRVVAQRLLPVGLGAQREAPLQAKLMGAIEETLTAQIRETPWPIPGALEVQDLQAQAGMLGVQEMRERRLLL